jgi:hypothetical protein
VRPASISSLRREGMRLGGVALMGFGGLALARLLDWDAQLGGLLLASLGGVTLNVLMAKIGIDRFDYRLIAKAMGIDVKP